ncbi:peptidoglycan -binding protein [Nisaea sp.]|uniref:peptidoglycan -binding protein n=1 Tax=Nisaea sp. TaxID=2024842 RepID=UPI003B51ACBE
MSARSRASTRDTNIWPGFVDALATLLMVIIFVLMVFIVSQFYLTQALSGRDEALKNLQAEIAELSDLLNLERETNAELRLNVAQLSTELQASIARRDALSQQVTQLISQRDQLEDRLAESVRDRSNMQQRLSELENSRAGLDQRLSEVLSERDALLSKLRSVENEMAVVRAERDEVSAGLEDAFKVIAADRETIKTQLKELESLRRDLLALKDARERLEGEVAELAALKETLESDLGETRDQLDAAKMTAEERQARIEQLRAEMSALRDRSKELTAELSSSEERTVLQQQEIEARDIRLAELTADFNETAAALGAEKEISAKAQEEVALLNRQMRALREQLLALQEAMDALEAVNKEQKVEIVDLGAKLNRALATKVQELARFRSEFFGRLREVLSGREGIRIVGDRFVFQSEVLFDSGSDQIGPRGQIQLRQFADQLKDIASKIPAEIDWILQVEGHTDPVPIYNERFKNNWDLSAARAISVVQTLIAEGIPAEKLSATGYGEFQPIDERKDEIGNRRNRRIEMKLTQR